MSLQKETIVSLLQGLDWFTSLNREELETLAESAATIEWEPNEIVFEEGDRGDSCYIIHSGSVKVLRRFPDGRRITLARIGPGAVFGELAIFEGERRSATVVTTETTMAVRLSARDVTAILRSDPEAALGMALGLADRLRSANERMFEYALATVSGRVAAALLAQVEARQAQGAGDKDIEVIGSPTDLARLAGAAKDSATRVLHWLENEGVLTLKRGKTIVHDPAALTKHLG